MSDDPDGYRSELRAARRDHALNTMIARSGPRSRSARARSAQHQSGRRLGLGAVMVAGSLFVLRWSMHPGKQVAFVVGVMIGVIGIGVFVAALGRRLGWRPLVRRTVALLMALLTAGVTAGGVAAHTRHYGPGGDRGPVLDVPGAVGWVSGDDVILVDEFDELTVVDAATGEARAAPVTDILYEDRAAIGRGRSLLGARDGDGTISLIGEDGTVTWRRQFDEPSEFSPMLAAGSPDGSAVVRTCRDDECVLIGIGPDGGERWRGEDVAGFGGVALATAPNRHRHTRLPERFVTYPDDDTGAIGEIDIRTGQRHDLGSATGVIVASDVVISFIHPDGATNCSFTFDGDDLAPELTAPCPSGPTLGDTEMVGPYVAIDSWVDGERTVVDRRTDPPAVVAATRSQTGALGGFGYVTEVDERHWGIVRPDDTVTLSLLRSEWELGGVSNDAAVFTREVTHGNPFLPAELHEVRVIDGETGTVCAQATFEGEYRMYAVALDGCRALASSGDGVRIVGRS